MPCTLRVMPCSVFRSSPPLLGVKVLEGTLAVGAHLYMLAPDETRIDVGSVSRMQANHADTSLASKGDIVVIELQSTTSVSLDGKTLYADPTPGAT